MSQAHCGENYQTLLKGINKDLVKWGAQRQTHICVGIAVEKGLRSINATHVGKNEIRFLPHTIHRHQFQAY